MGSGSKAQTPRYWCWAEVVAPVTWASSWQRHEGHEAVNRRLGFFRGNLSISGFQGIFEKFLVWFFQKLSETMVSRCFYHLLSQKVVWVFLQFFPILGQLQRPWALLGSSPHAPVSMPILCVSSGRIKSLTLGSSVLQMGGFHIAIGSIGLPPIAGWLISWKIPPING